MSKVFTISLMDGGAETENDLNGSLLKMGNLSWIYWDSRMVYNENNNTENHLYSLKYTCTRTVWKYEVFLWLMYFQFYYHLFPMVYLMINISKLICVHSFFSFLFLKKTNKMSWSVCIGIRMLWTFLTHGLWQIQNVNL